MARRKHTHKYHKVSLYDDYKVWACALENCNHYMPAHLTNTIVGKQSICWMCGDPVILSQMNMLSDRPKCDTCAGKTELLERLKSDISFEDLIASSKRD